MKILTTLARPLLILTILLATSRGLFAQEKDAVAGSPLKGEHVTVNISDADRKVLKDPKEFIQFLDNVYVQMQELTGHSPPVTMRTGRVGKGTWGFAGLDGVTIGRAAFTETLKEFNEGRIVFGLVHETGHVFDARDKPRWYISPSAGGEEMANLKLSFALDRLLRADTRYRIDFGPGGPQTGVAFNDGFYLKAGDAYLADPKKKWTELTPDELEAFHFGLARKHGWDLLKKWFRTYPVMEEMGFWAPQSTDDPQRMIVECAIFTHFTGQDLMPEFTRWRLPVTKEAMDEAVTKYRLADAFKKVEKQFDDEVAGGTITPDGKEKKPPVKAD